MTKAYLSAMRARPCRTASLLCGRSGRWLGYALALALPAALPGCIFIPNRDLPSVPDYFRNRVGPADSQATVRLGMTREQVRRELDSGPDMEHAGGTVWEYAFSDTRGWEVFLIPLHQITPFRRYPKPYGYRLFLRFDERGVLVDYATWGGAWPDLALSREEALSQFISRGDGTGTGGLATRPASRP